MNKKNERRVFITGASGFIGANLTRALLKNNYSIHVLNRDNDLPWRLKAISHSITIHKEDITKLRPLRSLLLRIKPDYIIHLATFGAYYYQTDFKKIIEVNIEGTRNLLEASRNISYKCFINTGSSSEYGYKSLPMTETDSCNPASYYAATKLATTYICKIFAQLNKKPIVTLRPFSVYGPYEEPTRFIPSIMISLLLKNPIKLTPGNQRRDFIYIDDVCNAYLRTLRLGSKIRGEIFNIGAGNEHTNDEIVSKLFKVTNEKTVIKKGEYPKRTWDTSHWLADISHAKKALGWEPTHTIDKGLKSTYSWFKKNIEFYKL